MPWKHCQKHGGLISFPQCLQSPFNSCVSPRCNPYNTCMHCPSGKVASLLLSNDSFHNLGPSLVSSCSSLTPTQALSQQMDLHSTQNMAFTVFPICRSSVFTWLSHILQPWNWILCVLRSSWLPTTPAHDTELCAILNVPYPSWHSSHCIVIACVLVYKLLDCQLLEGRDCVYLVHSCIPSTQHSAWHIVGA